MSRSSGKIQVKIFDWRCRGMRPSFTEFAFARAADMLRHDPRFQVYILTGEWRARLCGTACCHGSGQQKVTAHCHGNGR